MKEATVSFDDNQHPSIEYNVNRRVLKQDEIDAITKYDRRIDTPCDAMKNKLRSLRLRKIIFNLFPILKWMPKYSVKNYFAGDFIAGMTIAVMHIPQGMAYGILAGLDPIVGLYMAFFPALIYVIFGTSYHASPGTFAISAIMTSHIVYTHSDPHYGTDQSTMNPSFSNYQVATAVTMICGIFQLIMCGLRLGVITSLLSTPLVSGFTCAVAVHIIVAQSKDILGVQPPRHSGPFKLIYSVQDLIQLAPQSNISIVYVSIGCCGFMIFMNEIVKPWASKKCRVPIPAELICVVGSTAISYLFNLNEEPFNVTVVGKVPTGLPTPIMPPLELIPILAFDSIAICIVTYSIVISMSLIFAKKGKYEIDPNQELMAVGLANIVGSVFSCMPIAVALTRTVIQYQLGGKTQMATVVSATLILMLLLWLGPLFECLPRTTLASIVIVSLKGLIWQVKDLKKFSRESRLDVLVWVVTFVSVIILEIDIGLLIGALLSLFVLYLKGFKSYCCMLGQVPNTDIYVDLKTHKNAHELTGTKIFKYCGSINFATCLSFKKSLCENIGIDFEVLREAAKNKKSKNRKIYTTMQTLIIDLSAVHHIDINGYRIFVEIRDELKLLDVKVFLAAASDCVYDQLTKAVGIGEKSIECYPTLHDAVLVSLATSKKILTN